MKWQCLLWVTLFSTLNLSAWSTYSEAAGPWKAQIVDAETKQPLEGVVVLAWWTRHVRGFPGGPSSEYHDSEEVLTDKDGRFTIAARSFFSLNPLVFFRGPEFTIFRPGYGRWDQYGRYPMTGGTKGRYEHDLLSQDDIVVDLPRLQSLAARKEYIGGPLSPVMPLEKMPLLQKAIREERRAIGYRN